jgi:hypothetical protein
MTDTVIAHPCCQCPRPLVEQGWCVLCQRDWFAAAATPYQAAPQRHTAPAPTAASRIPGLLAEREALNRLMADDPKARTGRNARRRDKIARELEQYLDAGDVSRPTIRCQGPGCSVLFVPSHKDQRYHDEACKKRAKRAREGANTRFRPSSTSPPRNAKRGTNGHIGMRDFDPKNAPSGDQLAFAVLDATNCADPRSGKNPHERPVADERPCPPRGARGSTSGAAPPEPGVRRRLRSQTGRSGSRRAVAADHSEPDPATRP